MARNTKGDGSINQIKDKNGKPIPNRWRVCVSLGTDLSGNRIKVQRNVNGTKAQARKVRDQIRQEHEQGLSLDADKVTLSSFIEVWLESRRTAGKVAESAIKNYDARLKQIEPYLGKKRLNKITAAEIERAYSQLRAKSNLSGTTLNKLHILLKSVFEKACDYDLILRNPCNKVEAPSVDKPDRKSLTKEEGAALLHKLDAEEARIIEEMDEKEERQVKKGNQFGRSSIRGLANLGYTIGTRIALATGLRRGEVFALSWENVDLERRTIRVCQSITYQRQIKTPKTQAGIRTLAIDATTASHLSTWKERQAAELAKIGVKQTGKTPVCCSDTGSWYRIDNFEHWWGVWRKEHGFDGLKFHELRHTQATQLLANGVDVKTVQTRLGHASASITLGWYAHAIPEKDHEAADLLGAILSGTKPQENATEEEEKSPEMSPETESSRMSPECPLDAHGPEKRKQASRLKKAS